MLLKSVTDISKKWQTSHDERIQDSHKARNGKTYAWPDPGPHTRAEVNCRCDALPILL